MLGCYKRRAVPINVNYRYGTEELAYLFADSEIVASKPEAFRIFLAAERLRWARLVKETGITLE